MRATPKTMRRLAAAAVIATAAATATACATELPTQPIRDLAPSAVAMDKGGNGSKGDKSQQEILETIRKSTERYQKVDAALADGYVLGSPCESMPGQGIGIHYRKASLFDAVVDPSQPELLVYEPRTNGKVELVAVAFVVPAAAWDPTHTSPPKLGDQVFEDKRVPDWSSPPFPNYELHVWVWKHNPNGVYATTNPKVSCDAAQ